MTCILGRLNLCVWKMFGIHVVYYSFSKTCYYSISSILITNYPMKQKIRTDLIKRDYRSRGVGTDPSVNIIHVAILKLIGRIDIFSGLYSHIVVGILKIREIATKEYWNELYIICTNACMNICNIKIFF